MFGRNRKGGQRFAGRLTRYEVRITLLARLCLQHSGPMINQAANDKRRGRLNVMIDILVEGITCEFGQGLHRVSDPGLLKYGAVSFGSSQRVG